MRFALPIVLVATGLVLLVTAVPGTFVIDEHSYIATIAGLRDGSFRLPETSGLPPSPELLSFDAAPLTRTLADTPAAPNTPPLYAVLALPFSYLGVYGLIALQILAFVLCAWLVFRVVRRETGRTDLAWFALAVFGLAGFSLEYAQAIWPHATTMALVMAAVDRLSVLRRGATRRVVLDATLAGLCIGLAAGMRYQNIVLVAALACALCWVRNRRRAAAGYVLGAALPLLACSLINASRLDSWNPVSKGETYLGLARKRTPAVAVEQAFTSTYARVVDYSAWVTGPGDIPRADSGAFVLRAGIKKALLQSAPWIVVPLLALLAAWRARAREQGLLRILGVVTAGVLALFALYGFRSDGWCFNQRYLLELVPLFAVALALALVTWTPRWRVLAASAAAGAVLGAAIVHASDSVGGQIAMMKVPLAIAAVLAVAWLARRRTAVTVTLGIALGWATSVHITGDLPASRELRAGNAERLERFLAAVPDDGTPLALFAYGRAKDAYGPLLVARPIVIIDPWIDNAHDAPMLLDAVLHQGRAVYLDRAMPAELFAALTRGRRIEGTQLVRVTSPSSSTTP